MHSSPTAKVPVRQSIEDIINCFHSCKCLHELQFLRFHVSILMPFLASPVDWFSNGCTVGCDKCDGTQNHVGHGSQTFLYKGMTASQLKAQNITINPWSPKLGDMKLKSRAGIKIAPNCDSPKTKPTICDPKLRSMNTQAECGGPDDIYYWSPWRAPGAAPVIDSCGVAGGRFPGMGIGAAGAAYMNTSLSKVCA